LNTLRILVVIALSTPLLAQAVEVLSRDDIVRVFHTYEALNADFVYSASAGSGKNGKPYVELRREAEAYAEGPFAQALRRAKGLLCACHESSRTAANRACPSISGTKGGSQVSGNGDA